MWAAWIGVMPVVTAHVGASPRHERRCCRLQRRGWPAFAGHDGVASAPDTVMLVRPAACYPHPARKSAPTPGLASRGRLFPASGKGVCAAGAAGVTPTSSRPSPPQGAERELRPL